VFRKDRIQLVTQSQVYCEPWAEAPVVLNEDSVRLTLQVPQKIPGCEERPVHIAGEEILQGGGPASRIAEPERTLGICSHVVLALEDQSLAAELDRVVALEDRDGIGELPDAVRTYCLGPTQPHLEGVAALIKQ